MDWDKFARKIFTLQNQLRKKPTSFIPYLQASLKRFHGNILTTEDGCNALHTDEGPAAFEEAIEYLKV